MRTNYKSKLISFFLKPALLVMLLIILASIWLNITNQLITLIDAGRKVKQVRLRVDTLQKANAHLEQKIRDATASAQP
jgi:HAMP domain-containing protein